MAFPPCETVVVCGETSQVELCLRVPDVARSRIRTTPVPVAPRRGALRARSMSQDDDHGPEVVSRTRSTCAY